MPTRLLAVLALAAFASAAPAQPLAQETKLFNGKDLTNFYTFLRGHGKNVDPDKVFSVVDGAIRISGQTFGALTTEQEFENYHLTVEFKWGEQTFAPRAKAARDSGVLLHCVGSDGAASGVWMESIECQLIEGGSGDLLLVGGKGRPTLTARAEKRGNEFYFSEKAEPLPFKGGRINWFGRDPAWKDLKGFRGKNDVERPVGQWNTLECVCKKDSITNILNGTTVNVGTDASHTRGKIQIQSEGAEIFVRRFDLKPLQK